MIFDWLILIMWPLDLNHHNTFYTNTFTIGGGDEIYYLARHNHKYYLQLFIPKLVTIISKFHTPSSDLTEHFEIANDHLKCLQIYYHHLVFHSYHKNKMMSKFFIDCQMTVSILSTKHIDYDHGMLLVNGEFRYTKAWAVVLILQH